MGDLIARDSESLSLVARQESEPAWYPEATAPAARAQVWKRNSDQPPSAATFLGIFELGIDFEIDFNPVTDRNIMLGIISLSADGTPHVSRLEDAVWQEVVIARDMVSVSGIDEHVPTVTLPASIAGVEGLVEWIVLTPFPDAYGASLMVGEIKVEKADDAAVFEVWPIPVSGQHRIPQKPYPCKIYYRWRNQSAEDLGDGRGWSVWSPLQTAAESGAAVPPPPVAVVLPTMDFDPNDSMAGIEREVIAQ